MFNIDYFYFFIFLMLCFFISLLFMLIPLIIAPNNPNKFKSASYECGFKSNINFFYKYNIHFYLVAMLFLIFDLEILYILPWCLMVNVLNEFSFWCVIFFLFILIIGFIYEWNKHALYIKK